MYYLDGKVALVTGAGGQFGIGRSVALRLAQEGANVAVNDLVSNPYPKKDGGWSGLESVVREIKEMGREAILAVADVTDSNMVNSMVSETISHFGKIDILVTSHGSKPGNDRKQVVELEEDDWDKEFNVNTKGTFLCSREVARHMIKEKIEGNIIHIASTSGKVARPSMAAYGSSKAAVIRFSQVLALELASSQINVNSISPAGIDSERTGLLAAAYSSEEIPIDTWWESKHRADMLESKKTQVPLGRIAYGSDVANMVAFLASDQAGYLTGLAINVAGGDDLDRI